MTTTLGFDELQAILRRHVEPLPDHRKPGPTTRYRIPDATLGAFGIFFTQSPSFLDYPRHLQRVKGQNNALTLFSVEQISSTNQMRNESARLYHHRTHKCLPPRQLRREIQ